MWVNIDSDTRPVVGNVYWVVIDMFGEGQAVIARRHRGGWKQVDGDKIRYNVVAWWDIPVFEKTKRR